jgi:hypothetical protein
LMNLKLFVHCVQFFPFVPVENTETQLAIWWCYTGSNRHNSRLYLP